MTNSNPGGVGGKKRRIQTNKPQGKTSHRGGSSTPPKKGSGKTTGAMLIIPIALFTVPSLVVLAAIGYVIAGYVNGGA